MNYQNNEIEDINLNIQDNINDNQDTKNDHDTDINSVDPDTNAITNESKKKKSIGKEILEWVLVILAALLISMVLKAFVFSTYKINQSSMEDTLFQDQNVIVYKTGYLIGEPKHGDIIVFMHTEGQFKNFFKYLPIKNPGEVDYIKRVIGLPGDQIDIKDDGFVYRKAAGESEFKKLEEPYAKTETSPKGMQLPYTVPEGKLFVLGDNRGVSQDSREIGAIDRKAVIGKAAFRIWPFSEFGVLN